MSLAGGIVALDAGDIVAAIDLLSRRVQRGQTEGCSRLELDRAARMARLAESKANGLAGQLERAARAVDR